MRTRSPSFLVPCLAALILASSGCDSDNLLTPERKTLPLEGRVGLRAGVFLFDGGTATVSLRLETEKIYTCANYRIETQVSRDRHAITIRLGSVVMNDAICLLGMGPATGGHVLTLPEGTYRLTLDYPDASDEFDLIVRERAILRPTKDLLRTFLLPLPDIYVAADGSGDARTIREAMEMHPTQSSILLADGVYEGPDNTDLHIASSFTIRSANGDPQNCILKCDGTRAFTVSNGAWLHLDGLTIRDGRAGYGFGRVMAGGAISCEMGSLDAARCVFEGNQSWEAGTPPLTSRGASGFGGAIFVQGGRTHLNGCTFVDNAGEDGSAVAVLQGMATLSGCTIVANTSRTGALFAAGQARITVEQSIVAFERMGRPIASANAENILDIRCNDFFGNEGGDWVWPYDVVSDEDGNISGDPLFLDPEALDFTLLPGSPGSEAASACGRMGAWPEL